MLKSGWKHLGHQRSGACGAVSSLVAAGWSWLLFLDGTFKCSASALKPVAALLVRSLASRTGCALRSAQPANFGLVGDLKN
jgi:hypothetical protein